MKAPQLEKFKQSLLKMKTVLMNGGVLKHNHDEMHIAPEDLADEGDLASNIAGQEVTFNIKQRGLEKLKMIDEALQRMKEGTYGACEDCGEVISEKRLEHQPWATLCITHAEEKEREERKFTKGGQNTSVA